MEWNENRMHTRGSFEDNACYIWGKKVDEIVNSEKTKESKYIMSECAYEN